MVKNSKKKSSPKSSSTSSKKNTTKKISSKNSTKKLSGTLKKSKRRSNSNRRKIKRANRGYLSSSSYSSSDEDESDNRYSNNRHLRKKRNKKKKKRRSRSSSKETKASMRSRRSSNSRRNSYDNSSYNNNNIQTRPPVVLPPSPPFDHIYEYNNSISNNSRNNNNDDYDNNNNNNNNNNNSDSDEGTEWLHSDHEEVEVDKYKTQTELAMARMVAGQRESTVIASVAAREAAKLKYEVAKHLETNKALEKKIRDGLDRERAMTLSRSKDKMEVRELKYRVTYLTKELQVMKDADEKGNSKTKARIESMVNALNELEDFVGARARAVQRDVRHLKALLSSLQRHMSRGFVSSTSQTGQRLITALWKISESIINSAGPEALPKAGMAQAHVHTFRNKGASPYSKDNKNNNNNNNNSKRLLTNNKGEEDQHVNLATTMDGIVNDLENENRKLRAELDVIRNDFIVEQQKSKDAALIPQYRTAVRRARAHAESLRQRLSSEIQEKQVVLKKLHVMERKWRQAAMLSTANAERSVLADATAVQSHRMLSKQAQELANERAAYQQAYDDIARTAEAQQKLIVELQRIVDEQREQLELAPLTSGNHSNNNKKNNNRMLYHQQQQGKNRPSGNMISTTGMQNVGMGDFDFENADAQVITQMPPRNNDNNAKDRDILSVAQTLNNNSNKNNKNIGSITTDDVRSIGSSTDAGTELLGENASMTVAALNNDLQSLDSEIADLQESLRRIQMNAGNTTTSTTAELPPSTALVNNSNNNNNVNAKNNIGNNNVNDVLVQPAPNNETTDMQLDQEILL